MNRPAGEFGAWLADMRAVLRGERDADVPCDGCVGCCVSAYPVPLRPADGAALECVPAEFLSLPTDGGMARMNPRDDGTCPMLVTGQCRIYARRPQTCRDYDCRIYAAAGLLPDGERPVIRERVLEWQFGFGDERSRELAGAVRRAAAFIREHQAAFPAAVRANSAAAAAVLAVKSCTLFTDAAGDVPPATRVRAILAAATGFGQDRQAS